MQCRQHGEASVADLAFCAHLRQRRHLLVRPRDQHRLRRRPAVQQGQTDGRAEEVEVVGQHLHLVTRKDVRRQQSHLGFQLKWLLQFCCKRNDS